MKFTIFLFLVFMIAVSLRKNSSFPPSPETPAPDETAQVLRPQSSLKIYPPSVKSLPDAAVPVKLETVSKAVPAFSDRWALRSDLVPFVSGNEPDSVIYFAEDLTTHSYFPRRLKPADFSLLLSSENERSIFIGSTAAIRKTATERAERAEENARKTEDEIPAPAAATMTAAQKKPSPLPENSYDIVFFRPGTRDDGSRLVPVVDNALSAIQGPDYSLNDFDPKNDRSMREHLATILSLGHGGEIMLQVSGDGFIADEGGFDFALFENAFRSDSKYSQEFGLVGISESLEPSSFKWYPCDPRNSILTGCFGAVPTAEGGDQFDIADLGFKKIRYIWIRDLAINKNKTSKWPTEGCDLDAARLYHAYRN